MTWDELSPEQKHDAKERFLMGLADQGVLIQTLYGEGEERDPTYGELADADVLVPDDVMRDEGIDYVPEDFFCSSPDDPRLFTPEFVHDWCQRNLFASKYGDDCPLAVNDGIKWAKRKVQDLCERFRKGQLTEDERKSLPEEGMVKEEE